MTSRSRFFHGRYYWLALLVVGALAMAHWKGWLPTDGPENRSRVQVVPAPPARPASSPPPDSHTSGLWEEWQGCQLVEDRTNDGDSFVVRHGGTDHTLRIYFADCPEKHHNQYNGSRIAEQGRYFDGLSGEETVHFGEEARDFSLGLLRKGPFKVLTRWEPVFESGRYYAFIKLSEGDLGELLVGRGLARIYTKGENRPGGSTVAEEKKRLHGMEQAARRANRGAWARR